MKDETAGAMIIVLLIAAGIFGAGFIAGVATECRRQQQEAVDFDHAYFDQKTREFHWRHVETPSDAPGAPAILETPE